MGRMKRTAGPGHGRPRGLAAAGAGAGALLAALVGASCVSTLGSSRVDRLGLTSARAAYVNTQAPARDEAGGPLLLVLGASWLEQDLELGDRSVAFVDLPGRGRAAAVAPPEVDSARIEDDLESLVAVQERLGPGKVVILGWSYHGGLALRYALEHPRRVAGLVLISPLPPRRAPHWQDFLGRMRLRTDPASIAHLESLRRAGGKQEQPVEFCRAFTRLFLESRTVDPAAALARMRSEPCVAPNLDPELGATLGRAIIDGLKFWDWREDLAALDLPVLIIHGSADAYPLQGSREYASAIRGAQLVTLEETGHLPWLEQPEAFDTALQAFLDTFSARE